MYCDGACRQKAYRRRTAARTAPDPPLDPIAELTEAMAPFVDRGIPGISQPLHKALYRLRTAYRHGPQGQEQALTRLASMNPDRVKLPDTDEGRRPRAALRATHNRHTQPQRRRTGSQGMVVRA
ncbi:hypothetical protein [Streptomyces sp. NBC_00893]|uniref:hypothetical protein n=1 Tax=Streptomyces sp. NBC_00893 TaxID=2975862 RepID=UPI00224EA919|nr:hypothetical protein [Streptomyces sp. NBC_00893]MCX4851286.1 hypothetical protein [Streptomyces sp. NBC_00893]